ncbi:MAG TPA: pyrimidine/purine nucleoside phosphorylase [Candidatus Deferrimicrobiaceae bacterium]|jgi:hypothetical protein
MKHSVYFEGGVQSLGFEDVAGKATVGVIDPGNYAFGTSTEEVMSVVTGSLDYRLPGADWATAAAGRSFTVPPGVTFEVRAGAPVAYLCRYR